MGIFDRKISDSLLEGFPQLLLQLQTPFQNIEQQNLSRQLILKLTNNIMLFQVCLLIVEIQIVLLKQL